MELILLVLSSILVICSYLGIRNHCVCVFYSGVVEMAFGVLDVYLTEMKEKHGEEFDAYRRKYNEVHDYAIYIVEKNTYDRMLFSIKPLGLKYWFTEKEIEFLTKGTYEIEGS